MPPGVQLLPKCKIACFIVTIVALTAPRHLAVGLLTNPESAIPPAAPRVGADGPHRCAPNYHPGAFAAPCEVSDPRIRAAVGSAAANLLEPWPLKIVLDNVLRSGA